MGISLNIDTNSETEFNQQLQMFLAQGYTMQSNFNGTAILKKKSYSMGLLIVLIIFFFPAAIIYYLVSSDDVVTIRNNNNVQAPSSNTNAGSTSKPFDLYCEECGQGVYKDSKFCPNCGKDLTEQQVEEEAPTEEAPAENLIEESKEELKCKSCGTELNENNRFCPNCGESVNTTEE